MQIVWWITHTIELSENKVPDLDRLGCARSQIVDLRARSADTIRSLRWS
jgi:hypothetical protein